MLLSHHSSVSFFLFFVFGVPQGSIFVLISLCLLCLSSSTQTTHFLSQHNYLQWKFLLFLSHSCSPLPHQCKCFHLLAHFYAPSLRSLPDCLCFHAGSPHLFLPWYRPKSPLTFRLWPSNTASLCPSLPLALRLLLNSDSCLKVRILKQL